jgi:hypothetical protein
MRGRPRLPPHLSSHLARWQTPVALPRRAMGRPLLLRAPTVRPLVDSREHPLVANVPADVAAAADVAVSSSSTLLLAPLPASAMHPRVCTHHLHTPGPAPSRCGPTGVLHRRHQRSPPSCSTATASPSAASRAVAPMALATPLRLHRTSTGEQRQRSRGPRRPTRCHSRHPGTPHMEVHGTKIPWCRTSTP